MASKQIDFVSDAIVNRPKRGCFDNTFEDVSACTKLLLEATKFDDANVSHDVELKSIRRFGKNRHVQTVNLELVAPDRQVKQKSIVLMLQNVYAN